MFVLSGTTEDKAVFVYVPTLSQFFDCMMSSKYGLEIAWKEAIMARLKIFF